MKTMLKSLAAIRTWMVALAVTFLSGATLASEIYTNPLASNGATVTPGTYGEIVVPGNGFEATKFDSTKAIIGGNGSFASLVGTAVNKTDILTHTVSGWFKIESLDCDIYAALNDIASATWGPSQTGYKVHCTSEGKLQIGECHSETLAFNNSIEIPTELKANTWYYLTIVIVHNASLSTHDASAKVFVNGTNVYDDTTKKFTASVNGVFCDRFCVGAGVSAAGLYIDSTAVTDAEAIKGWATNSALVEAASVNALVGMPANYTQPNALIVPCGAYANTGLDAKDVTRMVTTFDVNGEDETYSGAMDESGAYPFAKDQEGSADFADDKGMLHFRRGKIYEGEALVRYFVPCCKDDGETGFWDLVEGKFYGNEGTGRFAHSFDGDLRLSWIQASGKQWIDTGVLGNMGLEAELDMLFPTVPSGSTTMPLAALGAGGNDRFYVLYTYQSKIGYRLYNQGPTMPFTLTANTRYLFKSVVHTDELSFEVDGVNKQHATSGITPVNTGKNLYMFACNENGKANYGASIRLFSAKISEGGTPLRDFVPARSADGVIGLIDLANGNKFYPNSGSGNGSGNVFAWGGIAYTVDGTTLKLHEGTLAAEDLVGYTAVEKVDIRYELNAGSVTAYAVPLTLSEGVFALTDGEVKKVTVGGKLTINGGVTLKIDAADGACDNLEAQSIDLTDATEDNPIVIEIVSAPGMDWSAGATLIANTGLADGPCANIRIADNDELQPVVKNGDLTIQMKSAAAHWTGEIGDNDPTNPGNWQERTVPTADTIVYFSGESIPNIAIGTPFTAKSVELNVTLAGDYDWRGLNPDIPVTGKIELNGYKLAVSKLTGDYEITDSTATIYERLEYIESTGTQYILTEADASTTLEAYGKFRIAKYVEGAAIFGPAMYADKAYLFVMQNNTFKYYGGGNAVWPAWTTAPTDRDFEFSLANNSFTLSDGTTTEKTTVNNDIGNVPPSGKKVALFACNHSQKHYSSIRAYSFKFVENGVVLHDFVPVKRASDGAIGLLDLANLGKDNEFYANKGSSTFTAGATTGYITTRSGSNQSATLGELHVEVASGETITNTSVTLSGTLKFVKEGDGTFEVTKAETYSGGTDVKGGTLKCGENIYPGKSLTPVTVYEGAIYDIGGLCPFGNESTVLAGGTFANTLKDHAYNGNVHYYAENPNVKVIEDSAISADFTFGIIASGHGKATLDLGGKELTISIASGKSFVLDNTDVSAGTLKTTGEGTLVIDYTSCRAAEADFDLASKVSVGVATEVHDLTVRSGTTVSGNGVITVNGVYRPLGATAPKVALKDGASFDLSTLDEALDLAGTTTTYTDNTTILIDVGERELETDEKVIAWSSKPANVGGLTFKFVGTKLDGGAVNAVVQDDGIYYPDVKTIVKATWTGAAGDGNLANTENWTCENALELTVPGALPGASTVVYLNGEIAFNVPSGATFAAGSVNANASLKGDTDWSGLNPSIPVSGTIDLKGHKLAVANLVGNYEITDSSATVYERLEYIQSSGSQWIDTGVLPTYNTKAELDMKLNSAISGNFRMFGVNIANYIRFQLYCSGNFFQCRIGTADNYATLKIGANSDRTLHVLEMDGTTAKYTCGDSSKSLALITTATKQASLYLFTTRTDVSDSAIPGLICSATFYGGKIWDGENLVRDFVPVKRVSDGAIGLLDLANLGTENEFYENKGTTAFTAGAKTGYILTKTGCDEEATPGEFHINVASGSIKNTAVTFTGATKVVKDGEGTLELGTIKQSNAGGWEIAEGTVKASGNLHTYTSFGQEGTTVVVREGATYDLNGQPDSRYYPFVLDGGTIANRGGNVGAGSGCMGPITLTKDSYLNPAAGFPLWGKVDLGGFKLTVDVGIGKSFYLYNDGIFENGTVDIRTGGWIQFDAVTGDLRDMRTVDFTLNAALNLTTSVNVRDLTVLYDQNYKGGSGTANIYGVFTPSAKNYIHNFVMQDGSTLNLAGKDGVYDLASSVVSGQALGFADGATINIVPGDKRTGQIVSWTEATKPADAVKFVADRKYGRLEVKDDGLYLHYGLLITIQ